MRRIGEREWPPGDLIPSEVELAAELGCSRMTVNRALRSLAERGFVDRKRKAGTRVVRHPARRATLAIAVIRAEVEARGEVYSHQLLQCRRARAPQRIAQQMNLPKDNALLHLKALHRAGERVFAYEDRWVDARVVPQIAEVDFERISCNEWLVANALFTHGELSIGAQRATETEAGALGCEPGEALLETCRVTWSDTRAITHVRLLHAPGHRLVSTL